MNDRTQGRRSSTDKARWRRWTGAVTAALTSTLLLIGVAACSPSQTANPAGPGTTVPSSKAPSGQPSSSPSQGSPKAKKPSKQPSVKTKPVPPPVKPSGNVKQKSTTHKVSYKRRVPLHKGAAFGSKVAVKITDVKAVTAKPIGPGEVGGSAVAVTVKITNGSSQALNLATTTVTMLGSDGSPGLLTTGGDAAPLSGMLATGDSADGTYVFTIAKKLRKPVTVQVQYGAGRTVLQFSGNAA
jgi:hypothetical protein